MSKTHVTVIAGIAAAAFALGGVALTRSAAGERSATDGVPVGTLSARSAKLDALEADLQAQLKDAPAPPAPITRVVRPRVQQVAGSSEDREHEYENESGSDDGSEE